MSDLNKTVEPLELDIFGLPFRLRAPLDEHDRLKRAAIHVDNVLKELASNQKTPDTGRLAIQAAMMITLDYIALMDDITSNGTSDRVRQRVDDLLRRLDESLNSLW
jgi:cell division protein ZapA (FtsZ GTPase activity inhibitor)